MSEKPWVFPVVLAFVSITTWVGMQKAMGAVDQSLKESARADSALYAAECRGWMSVARTHDDSVKVMDRHPREGTMMRVFTSCAGYIGAERAR